MPQGNSIKLLEFHGLQPQFLSRTFRSPCYSPDSIFTGFDINLYYDVRHPLWYKRPDWFAVVGVPRLYDGNDLRSSYVIWQEGVAPFVIVELLSPGTEREDLGESAESEAVDVSPVVSDSGNATTSQSNGQTAKSAPTRKWEVYEQILRVPYYIVFSRYTNQVRFFHLVGAHYQEQELNSGNPRIWIPELEIGLGLWQGEFEGITCQWLRWYDAQGIWVPTDTEQERQEKELAQQSAEQERQRAEQERQRAEQERQRAEQERQRAEQAESQLQQVAMNLLRSGMLVEQVIQFTGLPTEIVLQLAEEADNL